MPKRSAKLENTSLQVPPDKVQAILKLLELHYPTAKCSLYFTNPLELAVATILSAQCTDERVNMVTPGLFKKYNDANSFAEAPVDELAADIRSINFFTTKAKNIKAACQILVEQFGGKIPADMASLVSLPGVGRKTANVILGNAFGIPSIVVDTHVARVSQRLGLTAEKDPNKIERDLMAIIPKERWTNFCHQLIQHGRAICQARKPKTEICPLNPHCDHARHV
jgi:endonuclease-3